MLCTVARGNAAGDLYCLAACAVVTFVFVICSRLAQPCPVPVLHRTAVRCTSAQVHCACPAGRLCDPHLPAYVSYVSHSVRSGPCLRPPTWLTAFGFSLEQGRLPLINIKMGRMGLSAEEVGLQALGS